MKKMFLLAAVAMLPFAALAEDAPAKMPMGKDMHEGMMGDKRDPMSLEDARKRAHARAEKLDKMTEEEWKERQKRRAENREKWQKMTPEERQKFREEREKRRAEWQKMTPEEREKAKAEWLETRKGKDGDKLEKPAAAVPAAPAQ